MVYRCLAILREPPPCLYFDGFSPNCKCFQTYQFQYIQQCFDALKFDRLYMYTHGRSNRQPMRQTSPTMLHIDRKHSRQGWCQEISVIIPGTSYHWPLSNSWRDINKQVGVWRGTATTTNHGQGGGAWETMSSLIDVATFNMSTISVEAIIDYGYPHLQQVNKIHLVNMSVSKIGQAIPWSMPNL